MRNWCKAHREQIWACLIGSGLVLFAVHNRYQPLKEYAFLPVVGLLLSSLGVLSVLQDYRKSITLGSRWLYIPMLTLVASIAGSGFINGASAGEKLAPLCFGLYLFGVYLVARILGEKLFAPFTYLVIPVALSCIAYGIIYKGVPTGGLLSPSSSTIVGNYDIAGVFLIFGTLVSAIRRQWWLAGIALIGIAFTGAVEALFTIMVLCIYALWRRDLAKKVVFSPVTLCSVALVLGLGIGHFQSIYLRTYERITTPDIRGFTLERQAEGKEPVTELGARQEIIQNALERIKPFGNGYNITNFNDAFVHNVPLVIVDQVGILGALAWVIATGYCLIKTKWKYAWLAVISLGIFDHSIWTQIAPWWWALAGVSTVSGLESDLIFNRKQEA